VTSDRVLTELRVRGYAVIDDVRLELGPGLNVLTGETGAGKSILVGALSLLLGERASSDVVRAGEERSVVEGVFNLAGREETAERAREAGYPPEDGLLILRREVQREGRNRVWINGSRATVGLAGELGSLLVDLHGQHEHQALLRPSNQRRILDAFAGARDRSRRVRRLFRRWKETREEAADLRERGRELSREEEFLRHKLQEIESADLEEGEVEELKAEENRLANSEELVSLASDLYRSLYEAEDSAVDRLARAGRSLGDLARIDPEAEEMAGMLEESRQLLQELGRRLGSYREAVDHDPARLEQVRARLDEIYRLERKYGGSVEAVLAEREEAREALRRLERVDEEAADLEEEAGRLREEWDEAAGKLSARREEAAERLEAAVTQLLPALGMEDGRFRVELRPRDAPSPEGAEAVEFLVSLNVGFEPGPLDRVASGGELSRVMLALKTVLAEVDEVPCLVFDEIDAGVGGEVAHQVARRLQEVAERHQVFVITHLPQIAARADVHYRVEKSRAGGRASTVVDRLDGDDRVEEVARMLGGDPGSRVSREHARELLEAARGESPSRAGSAG
jgi:DNA repair protein RecN (Recombination protein N)